MPCTLQVIDLPVVLRHLRNEVKQAVETLLDRKLDDYERLDEGYIQWVLSSGNDHTAALINLGYLNIVDIETFDRDVFEAIKTVLQDSFLDSEPAKSSDLTINLVYHDNDTFG